MTNSTAPVRAGGSAEPPGVVIEGLSMKRPKSGCRKVTVDPEATMHADLDTLLTTVYCMADDLLPCKPKNARRRVTDAELVTLCVAQAIMGEPEDPRFLARARKELRGLFPKLPQQPGYWKRRQRLAATIERLAAIFAAECPGATDDLVLIDSTPVEWDARWIPPGDRSSLRGAQTATAKAIRGTSGGCACTAPSRRTARPAPGRWRRPTSASARWPGRCSRRRSR